MFAMATLGMALVVGGCAAVVTHGAKGRFAGFMVIEKVRPQGHEGF